MNIKRNILRAALLTTGMTMATSCHDLLDERVENKLYTEGTDYSLSENMILPLLGAYGEFYSRGWEDFPLISVRGDDVNAGGQGDQQDYAETDKFNYNKGYWMYNSVWRNLYGDIIKINNSIEQINRYKEETQNKALADQYIAEAKTMRAYLLFSLSRVWGRVWIIEKDDTEMFAKPLSSKDDVMKYIAGQMDEVIPLLPSLRPNERTDIKGGVTRYTALAIKALANLELKNYSGVAEATSQIISSGKFSLEPDYYNLFKLKGKLNNENLLELQYSDFGQGAGDAVTYLFAFFGPENWTPKVAGAGSGWGFYEPSLKYIKFMLARGERTRLETSVLFTNRGINKIKEDPAFATLPAWVSNTTPSGDLIRDYNRAMFASGKHYLPSELLTPGRTDYGTNKNFTIIRYAEILLMHAEALKQGAASSAMTADAAVNMVRARAGLSNLSNVTLDQVLEEKYAELAMEWGTRYYDLIRLGRTNELNYEGRTFREAAAFLPYPQNQVDLLPSLRN